MSRALVVLVGGKGERLGGVVKPLLLRPDGKTLLEHLVQTLSPIVDEVLHLAPSHLAEHFPEAVQDPGRGPGRAVFAAKDAAKSEWLLVVGGDQVSPQVSLAERLFEAALGHDAAAVEGQPLFAVYRRDAIIECDSLWGLLNQLDVVWVEGTEAAFEDVDTPADLERFGLST